MKHKGTVRLESARLILRRFEREDIPHAFENWMSDTRVTEFLRWKPHADISVTESVISEWISSYEKDSFYQWAIELKDTGELIGTIAVVGLFEERATVHIGYSIGFPWWNKGYTSEALARIIKFFFEETEARRLESWHDPSNPASGRVMEKCGLKYEGTLLGADYSNRGKVDAAQWAISREQYENSNKK